MLQTLPWAGIEATTSVVIGTDYIGGCKSKYHMIMSHIYIYINEKTEIIIYHET
jgi:hypothetical protein